MQAAEKERCSVAVVSVGTLTEVSDKKYFYKTLFNLQFCVLLLLAWWPHYVLQVMFTTLPTLFPVPFCS